MSLDRNDVEKIAHLARLAVTSEEQDRYAAESYRRSVSSIREGRFEKEIVAVDIPGRKGAVTRFAQDECPRETDYDALSKMKPAFKKDGVI